MRSSFHVLRAVAILAIAPAFLAACDPDKISLGTGAPPDARLFADVYTWECEDLYTYELYEGVFAYDITLEYAPDNLRDRDLPASGCTSSLDLFPSDAGAGSVDIPDVTTPSWTTGEITGFLAHEGEGFYRDNVFDNVSSCTDAADLLQDGTTIGEAGVFSGASAPPPGDLTDITIEGEIDETTGIPFGAEVTASWDVAGWDRAWVQVRREKAGVLVESVTCAAEGDSYTLGNDAWSLLSDAIEVDVTNVYIAFEVDGTSTTSDGQEIVTSTRAMHVAVVQD